MENLPVRAIHFVLAFPQAELGVPILWNFLLGLLRSKKIAEIM